MNPRQSFARHILRENRPLLDAIVSCNRLFPSRIRTDAIVPEYAPLLPLLKKDAVESSRFTKRMHSLFPSVPQGIFGSDNAWSVCNTWALDFRLPRHRLALLPPDILVKLARYFGLVRHRAQIRRLIDRDAVLALREEVGEEGRRFVLRRSILLPGARPEVREEADEGTLSLPERIRHSGFSAVASCLADAPFPLTERLSLTVPGDFAAHLAEAGRAQMGSALRDSNANHDTATEHWALLRTLLFKEIAPEWEPCFL
ncbi:MAG: Yop proteins translocation protein K [Deltaproteobacteria bacterium]|jgi:hypothetical protein|nr:Yop proteins translocation protein K [Deltaproteobacteria bacterium]